MLTNNLNASYVSLFFCLFRVAFVDWLFAWSSLRIYSYVQYQTLFEAKLFSFFLIAVRFRYWFIAKIVDTKANIFSTAVVL